MVNQLAAANARQTNDMFFTWTCNAKQTFGVRNITAFMESDKALALVDNNNVGWPIDSQNDICENALTQEGLRMSAGNLILRCWLELVPVFLEYLQKGKDLPFRCVQRNN
jgi:hypothetical protein